MGILVSRIPHHLVLFLLLMIGPKFVPTRGADEVRCVESEKRALLEFKKGVDDEFHWLSSWGDEHRKRECCEWEGVTCENTTGHVVSLDLRADYKEKHILVGKISTSLMMLHQLEYLDLSCNVFFGHVPHQLGNLSHLHYLNLSWLFFTKVGNLKWLSHMINLQSLDLSYTDASAANDWTKVVGRLTKLSTMKLSLCGLTSPAISSISHVNASKSSLVTVYLDMNSLTSSIFSWISNSSSNVGLLKLFGNQLTGPIPDSFGSKMDVLTHLDLGANKLEGEIPRFFGKLCGLKSLNLFLNNVRGQLDFIGNLSACTTPALESLNLGHNSLSGPLPDFSEFSYLKELDLSRNSFTGSLPKSIGNLLELETLDVSSNNLDGIISEPCLSNLSKLKSLGLSCSYLKINSNWVPPFQLEFLTLKPCKLGRPYSFPSWLRTQKNISVLDIASLGISDTIPHWFWSMASDMLHVNLSNNDICGTLPRFLRNLRRLSTVDLSSNRLEGPLPNIRYANLTMHLDLSNNNFSGSISPLCSSGSDILDLSKNRLSGVIPSYCPANWNFMIVLDLASNNFSGKIPPSMGSMTRLHTLVLRKNSFFGKLPSSMKKCEELTFMDLGDNKLFGKVPSWLGERLSHLKILILRSNKFHGTIPLQLCKLQDLHVLDLGQNNMSGTIPQCFSNFTAMTSVGNISNDGEMGVSFFEADLTLEMDFKFVSLFMPMLPINLNFVDKIYSNEATILLKGRADLYVRKSLQLMRGIDLSGNRLTGNIPDRLLNLSALVALNLSANKLSGTIPLNIGRLNQLLSLDLSWNEFSGYIPTSMESLNFLSYLDLSHNNLSGKIPLGGQLQTFNASFYADNPELCGLPLTENCPNSAQDIPGSEVHSVEDADEFSKWLFIGASTGFVVGFWGVCGVLFFNRTARAAYFEFVSKFQDWLLLMMALHKERLLRRIISLWRQTTLQLVRS